MNSQNDTPNMCSLVFHFFFVNNGIKKKIKHNRTREIKKKIKIEIDIQYL